MFRKVHHRLAFLCAGVTIFILLVMSALYLFISEQSMKESQFLFFRNHVSTLLSNIGRQETLTHQWLAQAESNGRYLISILDNGTPLLHDRLKQEPDIRLLTEEGRAYAQENFPPETLRLSPFLFQHNEFIFDSAVRQEAFYGCQAYIARNGQQIDILILTSMKPLNRQIRSQRILFLLIDAAAALCLFLFSWHFTRKLLLPIEDSQRKQNEFIAAASHELRTPLAVVLSSLPACQCPPEQRQTQFPDIIRSECLRMSRLVDDLLTLAKADSHALTVQKKPLELDTLILNIYEAFLPVTREKNIRFLIDLPEQSVPAFACDQDRMIQLLEILLHNAVSYTPFGGQISLRLDYYDRSGSFEIRVEDSGIGVPDEEKEKIFRRFYHSDKARTRQTGQQTEHFGLGLSIAAEIVHAHNGKISVQDREGGGAAFVCRFF